MYRKLPLLAAALAAALLVAPRAAPAQDTGPKPAADSVRRMRGPADFLLSQRNDLQLTDDQVKRLEEVRSKYEQKDKPLLDAMKQLRANRQAARQEALGVLTPEQRQKLASLRAERRAHWRARGDSTWHRR